MSLRIALLTLSALSITACDRPGERDADAAESSVVVAPPAPSVTLIELGRQSGGETLRVTEPSATFGGRDTVFLSVGTANAASDTKLSARWTFSDGSVIDSSAQAVAREAGSSEAVTRFSVMRDKGWSVGKYTVDIWMNDMLVGTRQFDVKR